MNFKDLQGLFGADDAAIAAGLDTSRQLVRYWREQGKIPKARQALIQAQTKGKLKADLIQVNGKRKAK